MWIRFDIPRPLLECVICTLRTLETTDFTSYRQRSLWKRTLILRSLIGDVATTLRCSGHSVGSAENALAQVRVPGTMKLSIFSRSHPSKRSNYFSSTSLSRDPHFHYFSTINLPVQTSAICLFYRFVSLIRIYRWIRCCESAPRWSSVNTIL